MSPIETMSCLDVSLLDWALTIKARALFLSVGVRGAGCC